MNPNDYYRLPWTLNDNVLSWLEPTKKCNIYCEGCYSTNEHNSHKTLEQVRCDLDVFVKNRRMDSVSIAGGDPLTHPGIVDIVRMIKQDYGLKPVVNTNGFAMTPELLRDLKQAGLHGVTFHIDSSQGRPGWKNKDEMELCELRLQMAKMVADEGGLSCAFNATVFRHTAHFVPKLIEWAREHIDVVHSMVFILFRTARSAEFDYYAHEEKVPVDDVVYYDMDAHPDPMTTPELFEVIREEIPDFEACAYLGGTKDPHSFKWTLVGRVGDPHHIYGYTGPRFMELIQTGHHAIAGRYLAYSHPALLKQGKGMMLGFAGLDAGVRKAARAFVRNAVRHPTAWLKPVYFQSIAFIQPIDMTEAGEANMCDGCPDMTVHEGKLVWSCRLDELKRHGTFLHCVPRADQMSAK
ncbi:MAG: radical SAM protein [Myxococcota bacterium]